MLNKQIYGFKKSKAFGLCSVVVASYLLFSGVASADEVPSATAAEINTEAAQPTTAFKVSDNQVLDAEKAVDSKKAEIANVQNDVNNVNETVAVKTESVENLNAEKAQLTKDIEEAKNTTPADVAKIEENINAQNQAKADKTKELELVKTDEINKQDVKEEKAKEVEKAQDNVTKANQTVEAKRQALDPQAEVDAKNQLTQASKELENKEAKKVSAEVELNKAKEFDKDLADKKVAAKTDLAGKTKAREDKIVALSKATKVQSEAKEAVENAFSYPTKIITPSEWIQAFKEYITLKGARFDSSAWKKANPQKPGESGKDYSDREFAAIHAFTDKKYADIEAALQNLIKVDAKTFSRYDDDKIIENYTNAKDNSIVYDVNNIPTDVLIEVSQYFAHLVNEVRAELGITEKIKVHKDDIEFAREVAKSVVDNNYTEINHFGRGINDAARRRGLSTSAKPGKDTTYQYYENLRGLSVEKSSKITRQDLFLNIYNSVSGFFHEGPANNHYLHALSLLKSKNAGVALSYLDDGKDGVLKTHVISINPEFVREYSDELEGWVVSKELYEARYGRSLLPNAVYEDKNILQAKLDKANADLASAQNALTAANNELANAQSKVTELNAVKTKTPEAQAKYDEAVKAVKSATEEKEKAEKHLQFVTSDKLIKEKALNEALKVQKEANDTLAKTQLVSDQAISDYNNAVNTRVAKEAEIASITKKIDELVNYKAEIENKIAKREENEAKLVEIDKKLLKLTSELNSLKAEEVTLKATISTLEKQLVELEKEYESLLGVYTKERMPKAPIVEDLPSIDIQELTRTEEIGYKTIEEEDTTLPVGEKVVKQAGKKGSKSVKTIKLYQGNVLIDEVTHETVIADAVNEVILIGTKKVISNIDNVNSTQDTTLLGQFNSRSNVYTDVPRNSQNSKLQDNESRTENKKLPNTGQTDTGIASMIGLAMMIAATKLRRRKVK